MQKKNFLKSALCFILVFLMAAGGTLSVSAATIAIPYDTKVTETLDTILTNSTDETQRVLIWLEDVDTNAAVAKAWSMTASDYAERILYITTATTLTEAEEEELDTYIAQKRSAKKSVYQKYTAAFSQKYLTESEIIYASAYTPAVLAELTPARVRALAGNALVVKMDFYDDALEENDPIAETQATTSEYYTTASQVAYINADDVHDEIAVTGGTIKVGILDVGLPHKEEVTTYTEHHSVDGVIGYNDHATCVLEILYAVAPGANYYCTTYPLAEQKTTLNGTVVNLMTELEWFVDQGVSVVNSSRVLGLPTDSDNSGNEDSANTYDAVAEYVDMIIYSYDMLIVQASGNDGSAGIISGGMAYNAIVVGNYDRYSNSIANTSSYSSQGIKPDICAPGRFTFTYESITSGGTSFAAPMVTGTVALMMSAQSSLKVKPTAVKAILTASVRLDAHHYVPGTDGYQMYGAGIVDAYRAVQAAYDGDFVCDWMDPEDQVYTRNVTLTAGKRVRISLAYEKISGFDEVSLANMNLVVVNASGTVVAQSVQSNTNVEIVDFVVPSSGMYTIRVQNVSSATSMTDDTEYSSIFSISWVSE